MVKHLGPSHCRKLSPSQSFGALGEPGLQRNSATARTAATRQGGSKKILCPILPSAAAVRELR